MQTTYIIVRLKVKASVEIEKKNTKEFVLSQFTFFSFLFSNRNCIVFLIYSDCISIRFRVRMHSDGLTLDHISSNLTVRHRSDSVVIQKIGVENTSTYRILCASPQSAGTTQLNSFSISAAKQ